MPPADPPAVLTLDRIRADVAGVLELPVDEVGEHTDLLHLGLDSLTVMRLAARWRAGGAAVSFGDLIEWRTPAEWAALCTDPAAPAAAAPAVPAPGATEFDLTPIQHAYRYGRSDALPLGGVGSHFYVEFDGPALDPERLERAVCRLEERHPMLRARFPEQGSGRIAGSSARAALAVHDLRALGPDERARDLADRRERLAHRRLAVEDGEVLDLQLSLLPGGLGRLHLQIDMLVCDAQSFRILLTELIGHYADPDREPAPPGIDFAGYVAATADAGEPARDRARVYWRGLLADLPTSGPALPWATDPAVVSGHRTRQISHTVDTTRRARLAERAREHGLTETAVLLAAFVEAVAHWSATTRFLLSVPFYDREPVHPDVDAVVGDFTGLVLLDVDAGEDSGFAARAGALQQRLHEHLVHAAHSGIDLVRELSHEHGETVATHVVFTSATGIGELFEPPVRELLGEPVYTMSQNPQVAIDLQATDRDGRLHLHWDVARGLLLSGVDEALAGAVGAVLDWAAGSGDWSRPVPDLRPVDQRRRPDGPPDPERSTSSALTTAPSPRPTGRASTLHGSVFARARLCPDAPALVGPEGTVDLGTLAVRALALAGGLARRGVRPGDVVAVALPPGADQITAVLGVLAAGGAYVPIGVEQPPARRARILATAGARMVVGDPATSAGAEGPGAPAGPVVPVVGPAELLAAPPLDQPVDRPPDALAYVIFTSGSTGEPKGVEITHGAAMNTVTAVGERFGVGPGDRAIGMSALDFDLSVYDLFGLLGVGGSVVVVPATTRRDARACAALVREHRVTLWNTVPALLSMLLEAAGPDDLGSLRTVLVSGDRVPVDLARRLRAAAPRARFAALGGATEASIWSNVYEPPGDEVVVVPGEPGWSSMPYGFPLPGQRFRIVDERGRDRPDWVPGELWIGGAGIALGYRGDPQRSAERFPVVDGERWYRTGDLGRYRPGGIMEFLGRQDNQVKLRGHRIELGEVEAALNRHPGVGSSVAVVVPGAGGAGAGGHLGALVTPSGPDDPGPADVVRAAGAELPPHMVPETLVVAATLPLTANGKVDRRAVAELLHAGDALRTGVYEPPRGPVEKLVADLWSELLELDRVSRRDDFFRVGGDSLVATRMLARLRRNGIDVPLDRLLGTPVLAEFTDGLIAGRGATPPRVTADPANRFEPFDATEVQRAYWLGRSEQFALGGVGSHWYWEFEGTGVDVGRLEDALRRLVHRHDMLRAVFDGDGRQRVLPDPGPVRIPHTVTDDPDEPGRMRDQLSIRVPDPAHWPLLHVEAVTVAGRTHLAFSVDYLVLDALSIVILLGELAALYRDPDAELAPLDLTFRDYLRCAGPGEDELARARRYWLERLDDLPPAPALPLALDPAAVVAPRFVRREAWLEPDVWARLTERARRHGVTPAATLATAYGAVLSRWSGQADLTINLTLFDRRDVHPDVDAVLGDFTSLVLVPFRSGDGSVAARVREVQSGMWSAVEHRAASALWVLRELARRRRAAAVTMPVVLTSALGVVGDAPDIVFPFGEPVWGLSQTPQVWLDCQVTERAGGLSVAWDLVDGLFCPGVPEAMFTAFTGLLRELADQDWDEPVPEIPAGAAPRPPAPVMPAETSGVLHGAFFARAAREPASTALVTDDRDVTAGELAGRALAVAGGLAAAGVGPGEAVAVQLPRGVDQVVAVLGVQATGAAYVPIGVDQPPLRARGSADTAGVVWSITAGPGSDLPGARALADWERATPLAAPVIDVSGRTAYVIFTSGSTGTPKGVEMAHAATLNTIVAVNERFDVGPGTRALGLSSLEFDLSVYDVFGVLGAGGALVLVDEGDRREAAAWVRAVARHGVTMWNSVPALLEMALDADTDGSLDGLRTVLVSGDRVPIDLGERLAGHAPRARLSALGGATEAAIWSNVHDVLPPAHAGPLPGEPPWRSVAYGTPLPGQAFRVVDERGRDCPEWVTGELWIGGAGVATGYRGDPERTADRFVEVPGDGRWYRTGDLGRYRPGRVMEFLGRRDNQVKIRGHRVELGEIDAALAAHPRVAAAVTVIVDDPAPQPAAVVVTRESAPGGTPDAFAALDDLRAHLEARLPVHMLPARVTVVEALPLTPNGKIDRAAVAGTLARPDGAAAAEPPRGPLESELAELWRDLLDVAEVGRADSFFLLGGDSLLGTRLVERLRRRFGVEVTLRELTAAPTVRELAPVIDGLRGCADVEEGIL